MFLYCRSVIDKYAEITGEGLKKKLREYVESVALNFDEVKKYLRFYPDKVYRNIYQGGLMGELV